MTETAVMKGIFRVSVIILSPLCCQNERRISEMD